MRGGADSGRTTSDSQERRTGSRLGGGPFCGRAGAYTCHNNFEFRCTAPFFEPSPPCRRIAAFVEAAAGSGSDPTEQLQVCDQIQLQVCRQSPILKAVQLQMDGRSCDGNQSSGQEVAGSHPCSASARLSWWRLPPERRLPKKSRRRMEWRRRRRLWMHQPEHAIRLGQ